MTPRQLERLEDLPTAGAIMLEVLGEGGEDVLRDAFGEKVAEWEKMAKKEGGSGTGYTPDEDPEVERKVRQIMDARRDREAARQAMIRDHRDGWRETPPTDDDRMAARIAAAVNRALDARDKAKAEAKAEAQRLRDIRDGKDPDTRRIEEIARQVVADRERRKNRAALDSAEDAASAHAAMRAHLEGGWEEGRWN